MRRRLFFGAIIMVALILTLDGLGVPLKAQELKPLMGEEREYEAVVEDIEINKNGGFRIKAKLLNWETGKAYSQRVLLRWYNSEANPWELLDCTVSFRATLEEGQGRRNPGCFDYAKYLRSQNIDGAATITGLNKLSEPNSFYGKIKRELITRKIKFLESLPDNIKGLMGGVLFGDTSYLDDEIYEEFRANGTAHVLAVSGLHVGILYAVLTKVLGKRQRPISALVTCIVLLAMGTLASWSPSVTRASVMIGLSLLASYQDKRYDLLSAMSAIMIFLMLQNPYVVFGAGFQMSFIAAASIAFFMPHMPSRIPDFMAVILAVNIGLIPYQMYCFNTLSLTSFFANIPVVYIIGIFMPLGALQFVLFCLGISALPLDWLTEGLGLMTVAINKLASLGGAGALDVVSPPIGGVMAFYIIIFFLASETCTILRLRGQKNKIRMVIALALALGLGAQLVTYEPVSHAQVIFVDVGQGDCIHIREDKTDILIDGGGSISYNIGEKTLKPYLLKNGTRRVDMALATHLHTDHYKGLEELANENMIEDLRTGLTAGKTFGISEDVTIEVLWPITIPEAAGQEENENCSVFMITYDGVKILITGDLDSKGEEDMVNHYQGTDALKADILKAGHHGSHTSTCNEFLEAVSPDYVVIQVGKNNYGHPSAKVIEKCREKGIILLRNDINGAIGFFIDDEVIEYSTAIEFSPVIE